MVEVLLAIKNNNMAKIPNYDPSYSEHLKKLMKGFLHKGSCVTELRITLDDLLKGNIISFFIMLNVRKVQFQVQVKCIFLWVRCSKMIIM
jgi:hypothetical protein